VTLTLDGDAELQLFMLDACNLVCHAPPTVTSDHALADCRDAGSAATRLAQLQWLDDALEAATDAETAGGRRVWRVVVAHWPVASAGNHGDSAAVRASLQPLLARHRIDAVLAGHDHGLQHLRWLPDVGDGGLGGDDGGHADAPLPHVFVSGGGGYRLDGALGQHPSLVAGWLTHGFLTLSATADALHVDFHNADAGTTEPFYTVRIPATGAH
jgi:hypothetical protein